MILWSFSRREVGRRPGRALLTLLSVVIGVASVISVLSATRTTRAAYRQMFQKVNGSADLEITGFGGKRFDEELVAVAEKTPGVAVAVPLIHRNTILYGPEGRATLTALGIDPEKDSAVRDYELVEGEPLGKNIGVWMDVGLARRMKVVVGDEIKLLTRSGLKPAPVIGLVQPAGGSSVVQGGLVMMHLRVAQARFRIERQIDTISIVLNEDADENAVRNELQAALPDTVTIGRPSTRTDVTDEAMLANEQGLRLATAFILMLAVFVIGNTFAMNVGERRRQFAVMRAIGATRRQIAGVLYREALAMGVLGTILGIMLGVFGARILTTAVADVMLVELPDVEITTTSLVIATMFGLGLAMLGAYLPARQAAAMTPVEALVSVPPQHSSQVSWWVPVLGLLTLAVSAVLLTGCIQGRLPVGLAAIGSVGGLLGLVMLIPVVVGPVSALVERSLLASIPVESRLARRQLLRHRGRTTLTIGVLFIAMSTGIALATTISNNLNDVRTWYERAIVGDFFVRAMMPDMATGEAADMPESVRAQIESIEEVTSLDSLKFVSVRTDTQDTVLVVVREFTNSDQVYFDLQTGDPASVIEAVNEGQVVIGTVLSQRRSLKMGDTITIETADGPKPLMIAGIANDYIGGGLTVYMSRQSGKALLGVTGEDIFVVKCEPESLKSVEKQLESICNEHGLLLQSYAGLVSTVNAMLGGITGSLRALLVLSFVVASFGVVNTLTMNVLEQTRELGMLRIVAMTRWQVRRVIFAQAAMMGLIGLIPGAAMGVWIAYVINLAAMPVLGHPVVFHFYPWLFFGCIAAATTTVFLSAWIPAERAAQLAPTEALRYE
ncbi:ABC transporter permease [Stieleria varia]|uniref:ABC transporter permease YtrF n=1 Tax=Stieleria varia TaxID=2528005 RepID=A0A5C5ZWB6_9BACT|nr:FtsX-like permease family protein [Stieleria varia]TWT91281.1 ABC transporter permease YtrF precursor [Stieleria varia]